MAFISVFDLFKIGIGPSSSHTVGPMKAARLFLQELGPRLAGVQSLRVSLYGSLALTGIGHGTDKALLVGLSGETPDGLDPDRLMPLVQDIRDQRRLRLLGDREIPFDPASDLVWHRNANLPRHPNGMRFEAFAGDGAVIADRCFYSIGGGFIVDDETSASGTGPAVQVPYSYTTGEELLRLGREHKISISDMVLANEKVFRDETEIRSGLQRIRGVMSECIERGFRNPGSLPGGMKVKRRAPELYQALSSRHFEPAKDPLSILDWVNAFAISVNEENAAFGRVVTAPTNGAAGIIPAVLEYYRRFVEGADEAGADRFLLSAAAIGTLYKINASISGAEVGCQGEVGVASSMAAAALTEVLGGTNEQIENAAEIAMEHHLGMTCDPVGGLVQIPCIERNAMGAVKAINAARISLRGDGIHAISLDRVIKTMWDTGQDMSTKYKETSRGGLAVNVPEC